VNLSEAVVRLLLENRVDVEAENNDGTTARFYAAISGVVEGIPANLIDDNSDTSSSFDSLE
jgi:hypothetical protein